MTDRMRPSIWLVDTRSGEQMPLAAGPGAHSSPRWSPDGKRLAFISTAEGGAAQLFVRWMASGEAVRITGLPDAPGSVAWSPDGRQIAYTMFVPGEGLKLGTLPPRPEGAQWAAPIEIHTAVTHRTDEAGYVKPGFSHIFLVSADGGAPRQLTFGSLHDDGPLTGRRTAAASTSAATAPRLGARAARHRDLRTRHRHRRAANSPTATAPTTSRRCRPTGGWSPISASTTNCSATRTTSFM
jgi:Tol biopolymer transport system component